MEPVLKQDRDMLYIMLQYKCKEESSQGAR